MRSQPRPPRSEYVVAWDGLTKENAALGGPRHLRPQPRPPGSEHLVAWDGLTSLSPGKGTAASAREDIS